MFQVHVCLKVCFENLEYQMRDYTEFNDSA